MAQHANGFGRYDALVAFKKTFRELAPYKHRYEVFKDFVTMAACSLHNSLHKDPAREEEYLAIIAGYKKPNQEAFPKLMAHLVMALDSEPRDILGPLYMELEIANKDAGQFFTPPELSELMANLTFGDMLGRLDSQPFIMAGEPACGAGAWPPCAWPTCVISITRTPPKSPVLRSMTVSDAHALVKCRSR
jgi:type I restriction-modification system DNA methylase subunit